MGKRKKVDLERVRSRVEEEMRNSPTVKLLEERIAYHRAKLAEERAARERDSS
jgi:hypothetical protein